MPRLAGTLLGNDKSTAQAVRVAVWPLVLALAIFSFYLATLAPTVLWGDDAFLQRSAYTGQLSADGAGHWLWFQAARLFALLPIGDFAYRINMLSAVAAACTLLAAYGAARSLGLGIGGATSAVVSLAVAHTFWSHAVRAEVYTVFTCLLAIQLFLWFSWRERRVWPLMTSAILFGITLLGHQMALLILPAFAVLVWRRKAWLPQRQRWLILLGFVVGLFPFLAVIDSQISQIAGVDMVTSLKLYFTNAGTEFGSRMFDFSLQSLPQDLILWLGFLGLQFVGLAGLLGLRGTWVAARSRVPTPWLTLIVLYGTNVLFAISYRVNDQLVFFLPSYVAFAFFVGLGWQETTARLHGRWRRVAPTLVTALLFITPLLAYYGLTHIALAAEANPLNIRRLPGREPARYFLWPAKNGYLGAAHYAQNALDSLPEGSFLIADHTPLEPLQYYQSVTGSRPDVHLIKIEPGSDLAPIIAALPVGATCFLANDDPAYYNLDNLTRAELQPTNGIYRLVLSR